MQRSQPQNPDALSVEHSSRVMQGSQNQVHAKGGYPRNYFAKVQTLA